MSAKRTETHLIQDPSTGLNWEVEYEVDPGVECVLKGFRPLFDLFVTPEGLMIATPTKGAPNV